MGIFGFFKNREFEDKLHKMKLAIMEIAKQVDIINSKLRVPAIKKKAKETEMETEQTNSPSQSQINDGFDEVRALKKDLNMSYTSD